MRKQGLIGLVAVAAMIAGLSAQADVVTWTGGGDGVNWSDGRNWSGKPDNTAPTNTDTVVFDDAPTGIASTVDEAFFGAVAYVQINQSTTTATNAITMARDLTINSANTAASGLKYGSTISNAAMIEWAIGGHKMLFGATSGGISPNLYGTYTLDTAGGFIGTTRQFGTGNADIFTMNIGSGANLAVVDVTANATIGVNRTTTTTDRQDDPSTINIGTGSTVDVSENAYLNFLYSNRSDGVAGGANILTVNNNGAISVASGSILGVEFNQVNNSDKTINVGLVNKDVGVVNHSGTVKMDLHERGTGRIVNQGLWIAGTSAVVYGEVDSSGSTDWATVAMDNAFGGVLRGDGSTAAIDYDPSRSDRINQILTLVNAGTIAPGAGTGGAGTSSVGTFAMTDINVTNTVTGVLALDLGGTAAGTFDRLTLANGTLDLSAVGDTLRLTFVNGYAPASGDAWTIIEYDAVVPGDNGAGFDAIEVANGDGATANPAYYTISYGARAAQLKFALPGTLLLAR
jgi:hypothetical protein